eukprot:TRINITY_DN5474_c0_g1_i1.p1 TRINITY_DN5474_c0_g1~~TRINITY_DN5474_c0_g1_i1.p1  ORF type:complete len:114 (-),score=19.46 TRINITY_DN5474_c0_g1_i1:60-401(-)
MISRFVKSQFLRVSFTKPSFMWARTRAFSEAKPNNGEKKKVKLLFVNKDKSITEVFAEEGRHILEIAKENDIDLEGACEASIACSTCHVILEEKLYDSLQPPKPEEDLSLIHI